jgi:hypothetical protein
MNLKTDIKKPGYSFFSSEYTPGALAEIAGVSVPLESTLITWQH